MRGELVGAVVMPHGGIALAPWNLNTTNTTVQKEAWALHDACAEVAAFLQSLQPDIVLLSTPHGVSDLYNFVFYWNPTGSGSADTDNCVCPPCCFNVTVSLDVNLTESLVTKLRGQKEAVSAVSAFGPPGQSDEPFPLKWGEVIPLYFIQNGGEESFHAVILSQPSRRYTEDVKMIPELLQLGKELYHMLDSLPQRVAMVISGDLAHTHSKDGPYGYSPAAEPFDEACGKWVESMSDPPLLREAAGLVDKALSCGFTGFVMLHGMLQEGGGARAWASRLYANYHPSYYGMMVASFLRK